VGQCLDNAASREQIKKFSVFKVVLGETDNRNGAQGGTPTPMKCGRLYLASRAEDGSSPVRSLTGVRWMRINLLLSLHPKPDTRRPGAPSADSNILTLLHKAKWRPVVASKPRAARVDRTHVLSLWQCSKANESFVFASAYRALVTALRPANNRARWGGERERESEKREERKLALLELRRQVRRSHGEERRREKPSPAYVPSK